jgi:hypothetical protein
MNQWKYFKYILILFLFSKFSNQIDTDNKSEFNLLNSNHSDFAIVPTKLQIKYVSYSNTIPFTIKSPDTTKNLLVHLYSINCEFEVTDNSATKATMKKIRNDIFSFLIVGKSAGTTKLLVKPSISILDDINYKHSAQRICPIVVNSVYINDFKLIEDDKETMALNFDNNLKKFTYQMSNTKNDSFIAFSFMFDKTSSFNVTTPDGSIRVITNSTKLFFDSDYLTKLNKTQITITITPRSTNEVLLFLKVIESDSISILQKNYLNQGFITSNTIYQYYFMEVFYEEEGEVMLHNKRQNGKLYGIIKPKNIDPYNISEYLKNDSLLEFDKHNQKLSFKSPQTENCEKGCYLLITFDHQENISHIPIVGFEFTLLARIWDVENYINTPIINIPFNEYIFGSFEQESINHHYYSLFVPDGTDKIIIQMEGNYFDGFIGDGKRKLNTFKNSTEKLVMINNKNLVKIYNKDDLQKLKYYNNSISFSFRSKDFFIDTFSFYYFRVIQIKDNESLIYPLDSNVGDICLPELDQELNKYFCYFSLRNDYNEFSLGYSVSYPNQNENHNIMAYKYINENSTIVNSSTNFFIDNSPDYSFIIFRVEFNDDNNEYILSTFIDADEDINPQIYTNQLFYIKNANKYVEFKLKFTFTLILKWVSGFGNARFDQTGKFPLLSGNFNFKGKPFCFPLSDIKEINIYAKNTFIFITKLDYIMKDNEVREIFLDETIFEIFVKKNLPIYYYMKCKKGQEIDVNFKILNKDDNINTTTNFYIKGYFLNENNIKRKINGDIIDLKDPIDGQYDPSYGFGLLKIKNNQSSINKNTENATEYLLIEINSKNNFMGSSISIEILANLKNKNYTIVPINQLIQGYIEPNKVKNYLMRMTEEKPGILIEFSSSVEGLNLALNYSNYETENDYETGVIKHRLFNVSQNIFLSISSNKIINSANYNLRFFASTKEKEFNYIFNESSKIINERLFIDENDLSISFDNIKIRKNNTRLNYEYQIDFQIYGNLIEDKDKIKDEILNTTALIYSNMEYKNKTITTYNKEENFTLYFKNIKKVPRYYLKINIHIIIQDFLFNEDYLSYSIPIDLSPYIPDENKDNDSQKANLTIVIILAVVLLIVIIIIIVVFSYIYIKMKGENKSLEERVYSVEMLNANKKKEKTVFV